ncbi:Hypothetical_protein [Hexamita inflata]|uniref:Hypothetical_protein n=1 Tax=Hexamita inflata TaxID=28002 RepID=A0AA86TWI9_9EUKA|nr:Hypothetical protein HINF_LOCUS19169 [Hexamita inflata]
MERKGNVRNIEKADQYRRNVWCDVFFYTSDNYQIKIKGQSRSRKQAEWRDIACGALHYSSINGNQYNGNVEIHTINEFQNVKYFGCQQLISVFGGGYNNFLYFNNLYIHPNIKIAAGFAPSLHCSEM